MNPPRKDDYRRFEDLRFDDFREMAGNDSLSRYEKIGFPNSYREGYERAIFDDVLAKLHGLRREGGTVLDIGPGVSELPDMLISHCQDHGHELLLADAPEILQMLPDRKFIKRYPGRFPEEAGRLIEDHVEKVDVILCYSVLHYIFVEGNIFEFLDKAVSLLAPGGEMLVGDIPNISMRKRFFASPAGIEYHQAFTGTTEYPDVEFNCLEPGKIDDGLLAGLMARYRSSGLHVWLMPQAPSLPLSNRREDLYIRKP